MTINSHSSDDLTRYRRIQYTTTRLLPGTGATPARGRARRRTIRPIRIARRRWWRGGRIHATTRAARSTIHNQLISMYDLKNLKQSVNKTIIPVQNHSSPESFKSSTTPPEVARFGVEESLGR
jgi:hypothetical protein